LLGENSEHHASLIPTPFFDKLPEDERFVGILCRKVLGRTQLVVLWMCYMISVNICGLLADPIIVIPQFMSFY
jgi:hypothetical protein